MKIDRVRLFVESRILAMDQGLDHEWPVDCGWALLRDAARTFAALPGDEGRGYPRESAWPDVHRTQSEIFGVERERISDGVVVATSVWYTPSSRAISRAEEVAWLVAPCRVRRIGADPRRAMKAAWLNALDVPPRRVRALTGVEPRALSNYRRRVGEHLAAQCGPMLKRTVA